MTRRLTAAAAALLLAVLTAAPAGAQDLVTRMAAQERAVKQMPMHQRPNRLGHVYGNNVRRLRYGQLVVNTRQPGVYGLSGAVLRYLYLP